VRHAPHGWHVVSVYRIHAQAGPGARVQIELDPARIGLRYPVEVGLIGDSGRTLEALLPLLEARSDRSFLDKAQKGMAAWRKLMEDRGTRMDTP